MPTKPPTPRKSAKPRTAIQAMQQSELRSWKLRTHNSLYVSRDENWVDQNGVNRYAVEARVTLACGITLHVDQWGSATNSQVVTHCNIGGNRYLSSFTWPSRLTHTSLRRIGLAFAQRVTSRQWSTKPRRR